MSGHPRRIRLDQMALAEGSGWRRLFPVALVLGIIGVGASFALKGSDPKQFYFSWLVAFLYFLSLSLGALFFVLVHYATKAGWGIVLRRIVEHIMAALPLFALLAIPLAMGIHDLYHWSHAEEVAHDPILQSKEGYLNSEFFLIRMVIYLGAWTLLAIWYGRTSRKQDESGDPQLTRNLIFTSGPAIIIFALTLTFAAFDWIMSLDPHWYSTIFGVYFFAGSLVGVFSLTVLLTSLLNRAGYLRDVVTVDHFHDLGKLMFAFTVFWAYIGFSQYFLIWYANIPEETLWYMHRLHGGWKSVTLLLAIGHFAVPFLFLMPRTIKRRGPFLILGALWMLVIHLVDIYWLVMPNHHHEGPHLGLLDVTTFLGVGGLFLAVVGWSLRGRWLVPVRDPRLVAVRGPGRGRARPALRLRVALRARGARGGGRPVPGRVPAVGATGRALRHRRRQRGRRRHRGRRPRPAPRRDALAGRPLPAPRPVGDRGRGRRAPPVAPGPAGRSHDAVLGGRRSRTGPVVPRRLRRPRRRRRGHHRPPGIARRRPAAVDRPARRGPHHVARLTRPANAPAPRPGRMVGMQTSVPVTPVASADPSIRGEFVIRVYQHLLLAVAAFIGIETVLFVTGAAEAIFDFLVGASAAWLLVLGAFMVVNWMATSAAHNLADTRLQYAGLFGMAAGEALIFAPFLYYVFNDPANGGGTVWSAAVVTALGFAGLTIVAWTTRKDLSFLRPMLLWGGVAALVAIVAAVLFGLDLGIWFSLAMIALAGGSILYQTQQIMARYPSNAHVGAAVQLFASVMMLFWYVLRLFAELRR